MVRYRKPGVGKEPSMSFRGGPRKPSHEQWHMGRRPGAHFTCGLCHHHFTRRDNLNRHKRSCYSDPARVNGLVRESRLRGHFDPRSAARPLVTPKGGRPRHAEHVCGVCGMKLATASKKQDHQRCCQPFAVYDATKDISPAPNLRELTKVSR